MQVEALKIFCDVARRRSFSQGAAENHVTQSTASQTVHHLEQHLGVSLIERSPRPWRLTPEGETFLAGCRDIVQRYQDLEAAIRQIPAEANTLVRVAAIYSVGLGDMSQLLQRFADQHAPARAQIEYLHPNRVLDEVRQDNVDCGIISFPGSQRDLAVIPWRTEPMVVICHPQHRLARLKKVAVAQLAGEAFVGFDRGLVIRREIDRFLKRHQVAVAITLEFDNVEAIKRAVEVASGISILPRPTLEREVASGTLVAVPFADARFARPLGIVHRRGKRLYPSTLQFIALLQNGHNGQPGRLADEH